jgi:hypothetical protein
MSQNSKPVGRKDNLVVQELNGEVLVYDLHTHKALCLNETSALVWNACDGTRDLGELREYASAKMSAAVSEDLIWLAIDQLKKEDLLVDAPDTKSYFGGMSRREVVKRIGIGAAIAIPVVTGLVAPQAAHAASCGAACTCGNASNWAANQVCTTTGGSGTPCAAGGTCNVCHSTAGGRNSAGTCQTV